MSLVGVPRWACTEFGATLTASLRPGRGLLSFYRASQQVLQGGWELQRHGWVATIATKERHINRPAHESVDPGFSHRDKDWEETTLEPPPRELLEPEPPVEDRSLFRLLPVDLTDIESTGKRTLFLVLAIFLSFGYFYLLASYLAPAHPGVDQNGYLVGGKRLALTGSSGMKPTHPLQYVGAMWVMPGNSSTEPSSVWYYPKYPIGLPLLDAIPLWINWQHGKDWVYFVSPLSASLSLLAMFLLVRAVAGSFVGILAMLLLGINSTTLALANNPNSHAPALVFVTWGMFLLLRYWQTASIWRGVLAGFLLGFAVTIRYTEGLLLAPIGIVILCMIRYRRVFRLKFLRSVFVILRASAPAFGWAIPVLWLVGFNWFAMHSITGYDTTNESSAFTARNFERTWEFAVQQLYYYGLFLLFPVSLLGLIVVWRQSVRLGIFMFLWWVPGTLLYASYYWGNQIGGTAYLRFFMTVIPAMVLSACWFLRHGGWFNDPSDSHGVRAGAITMPIASGILVLIASVIALKNALPLMERESAANWNLAFTGKQITSAVPAGSVLFTADDDDGLLNYIQWKGDYDLYSADAFETRFLIGIAIKLIDNGQAQPLQVARMNLLQNSVYKGKTAADLTNEARRIMSSAIDDPKSPRRVFAIVQNTQSFRNRFLAGSDLTDKTVSEWKDQATVLLDPATTPLAPPRGFANRRSQQRWTLLEITRKPPAPTSAASTSPTTTPATSQAAE